MVAACRRPHNAASFASLTPFSFISSTQSCFHFFFPADAWDTNVRVKIELGDGTTEEVGFFHSYKRGVDRVFVDHPLFLAKARRGGPRLT